MGWAYQLGYNSTRQVNKVTHLTKVTKSQDKQKLWNLKTENKNPSSLTFRLSQSLFGSLSSTLLRPSWCYFYSVIQLCGAWLLNATSKPLLLIRCNFLFFENILGNGGCGIMCVLLCLFKIWSYAGKWVNGLNRSIGIWFWPV